MSAKRIISLFLLSSFLCCLAGCKKNETDANTEPENEISYDLSAAVFPNPERGFIRTVPVYSEGAPLSMSFLNLVKGQNITLVLRLFYLEKFKSQPISAAELTLIQTDLTNLRAAGLKVILRFAYTDDVAGTDASYATIEQHLDQLKPLFESNKDIIAFVQAGFVGAYGEWHSSSNGLATIENQRKVLIRLLSVLPAEIMVQVRTPGMKQQIFNTNLPVGRDLAYTAENRSRVGHHNDCFLTGGTEYGTYNNIVAEKQYISDEALYVPVGGETCPPTGGYNPDCAESQKEMKLLKWTYLNLDYFPATINAWRSSGCFDEFQKSLGYRLALVSSQIPEQVSKSTDLKIIISVSNKGYAPLYYKKSTYLVFKNKASGQLYQQLLNIDLRECKPNGTVVIDESIKTSDIPAGDYELFLKIADRSVSLSARVEYSVRLANLDTWVTDNGGMNALNRTLKMVN